jgi:hypothetical protein
MAGGAWALVRHDPERVRCGGRVRPRGSGRTRRSARMMPRLRSMSRIAATFSPQLPFPLWPSRSSRGHGALTEQAAVTVHSVNASMTPMDSVGAGPASWSGEVRLPAATVRVQARPKAFRLSAPSAAVAAAVGRPPARSPGVDYADSAWIRWIWLLGSVPVSPTWQFRLL